jgi:hypothetical protein
MLKRRKMYVQWWRLLFCVFNLNTTLVKSRTLGMVPNFLDDSDRKVSGEVILCHVEDNNTKDNEDSLCFVWNCAGT